MLCAYHWPGNIRELHNVLERAALLQETGEIRPCDLHLGDLGRGGQVVEPEVLAADSTLEHKTQRYIEAALRKAGGRVARAAQQLGMPRSTLYLKIKQYGLDPSKY